MKKGAVPELTCDWWEDNKGDTVPKTGLEDALKAERLSARMLLQVHDELVFETPDDEVEATLPVISRVMTEAPFPAVTLKVPLAVEARAAQNWDEAH